MDIRAISFKKFLKNKNDIYKNVNVVAKRARQIIDKRYDKVLAMQNIEDTEQLDDFNEEEVEQTKSISSAMDELLNSELEIRDIDDSNADLENE